MVRNSRVGLGTDKAPPVDSARLNILINRNSFKNKCGACGTGVTGTSGHLDGASTCIVGAWISIRPELGLEQHLGQPGPPTRAVDPTLTLISHVASIWCA
jgi:hypothetical protein